jgi:hypothetical protein
VGTILDGREKKVLRLVYNETPPRELIDYLRPKIKEFVVHNFIAYW